MLSIPIDLWFFVYATVILVLLLFTRENKDSAVPMVVAPIICNIIHFEYIKFNISAHIIEVILLEVLAVVVSVLIVKIIDWITATSNSFLVIICEIAASLGLVYFFYNIRFILEILLRFFK